MRRDPSLLCQKNSRVISLKSDIAELPGTSVSGWRHLLRAQSIEADGPGFFGVKGGLISGDISNEFDCAGIPG